MELKFENLQCRSLDEVMEQVANAKGNPFYQIEVLCNEIRILQDHVDFLRLAESRSRKDKS